MGSDFWPDLTAWLMESKPCLGDRARSSPHRPQHRPAAVTLCTFQLDALGLGSVLLTRGTHGLVLLSWDLVTVDTQWGDFDSSFIQAAQPPAPGPLSQVLWLQKTWCRDPGALAKSPAPAVPFWSQPRCEPEGCSGLPRATVTECLKPGMGGPGGLLTP